MKAPIASALAALDSAITIAMYAPDIAIIVTKAKTYEIFKIEYKLYVFLIDNYMYGLKIEIIDYLASLDP